MMLLLVILEIIIGGYWWQQAFNKEYDIVVKCANIEGIDDVTIPLLYDNKKSTYPFDGQNITYSSIIKEDQHVSIGFKVYLDRINKIRINIPNKISKLKVYEVDIFNDIKLVRQIEAKQFYDAITYTQNVNKQMLENTLILECTSSAAYIESITFGDIVNLSNIRTFIIIATTIIGIVIGIVDYLFIKRSEEKNTKITSCAS
ncbi:hypothetical protein [Cellulosilyticum ruminicola]|uniref:hypothetical protein n=1 Tax=Cellulosilyticum ruminicola TaxID=425254 RepID=UPI0006D17E99|nr:hypothetical protein [Cellulosilyticum ruminicola]